MKQELTNNIITKDSREVAKMVGKTHSKLMRDIRGYCKNLAESKIGLGDYFIETTYTDKANRTNFYML